jgi:hypothetical protein
MWCHVLYGYGWDHYGFGTGDEMRSQDESRQDTGGKEKKTWDQTSFLPTQVASQGGFTPSFGFCITCTFTAAHFPPEIKALSD